MINRETNHVEAGRTRSPFGYILVDESQDISPGRARLLNQSRNRVLVAVCDDWQATYRFGGSDIAVMRDFESRVSHSNRIGVETTCADRITAVAARFVLRNPAQISKTVHSTHRADGPAVHVGLPDGEGHSRLKELLERIAASAGRNGAASSVLLPGRFNLTRPQIMPALKKQCPGQRFAYRTVHAAKWLEADYVVVPDLRTGSYGYPEEIDDDPVLDLVLATPESYFNAEERRLLHVAIARVRCQVFLLAGGGSPSPSFRN